MSIKFKLLIACLPWILGCTQIKAQDLNWLSQPDIDIGLIANSGLTKNKISTNGRYVSFLSNASNMVAADNNFIADVFIRDRQTGITRLVSETALGNQSNSGSISQISAPTSDGQYVAFTSNSIDFPEANGSDTYLYLKNMQTGDLVNISQYSGNLYFNAIQNQIHLSDDGQFITFTTNSHIDPLHTFSNQVYRKDLVNETFELISISQDGLSAGNSSSELSDVSDNGRFILFISSGSNLTNDVINNTGQNFYIRDTQNNTSRLISIDSNGLSSSDTDNYRREGQISNNAQAVFYSTQSDLVSDDTNNRVDVFYYENNSILRINLDANGDELTSFSSINELTISGDGSRIVFTERSDELFPASTNNYTDLYSYATSSGTLTLISKNANGNKANGESYQPELSSNGNRLVFRSFATDLSADPVTGQYLSLFHYNFNNEIMANEMIAFSTPMTMIADVDNPRISSDQMSVIYTSKSPNLTPEPINGKTLDLFLLDRKTNTHSKIASKVSGLESDISASGQFISFRANTTQPDGNSSLGADYVFLYDRLNNDYTQIAIGDENRVNNNGFVVFESDIDMDINDTNGNEDIYVYNPINQSIELISKDVMGLAATGYEFDIGGSDDNIWVTFTSNSANIVINDNNNNLDIFLKNISTNSPITRITETSVGLEANGRSDKPVFSEDGHWIAFITNADNLTNDDYSVAFSDQILIFDRLNHQFSLVSINEEGMPLTDLWMEDINHVSISDSGRYVAYNFEDNTVINGADNKGPINSNFNGDTDRNVDTILFDTFTQTPKLISKFINGSQSTDDVEEYSVHIAEDLSVTPTLVGVVFSAGGGQLTGLPSHPGFQEAYLYQQGGVDLDIIFANGFE